MKDTELLVELLHFRRVRTSIIALLTVTSLCDVISIVTKRIGSIAYLGGAFASWS